ncbi:MAG: 3-dehydroquinate synthase [Bacteroidetes bacterium]|nr:3-dehydroquinate synthase [Bacteroidota bacterium]
MTNNKESFSIESLKDFPFENYTKVFCIQGPLTHRFCYPVIEELLPKNTISIVFNELNEGLKNMDGCSFIWQELINHNADRKSLIINLGGGVVTDIGGYCAATFKRGVHFINIPTTLLGMVDAAIGGKTGINFGSIKNQIGTFSLPELTIIDSIFLKTLPKNEMLSGLGEVLKYGLIKDVSLIKELESGANLNYQTIIEKCVAIKNQVVKNDPFENGERKLLNFGHTFGHALESESHKTAKPLFHGVAVAYGILAESWLAKEFGSFKAFEKVEQLINNLFGTYPFEQLDSMSILAYMKADKKNINGEINYCQIAEFGQVEINHIASETQVLKALSWLGCN